MRYSILFLAGLPILFGCSGQSTTAQPGSDRRVNQKKNIAAPFSVNLQLSEGARKKLTDSNETIVIAGYFTGHPKEGTEAKYLDIKSGDVSLGTVRQEVQPGGTAVFTQFNLNPDGMSQIDSRGPHILINVFSGRRSSKYNLLDCADYDGPFESLRGRTIVIRCQLIAERFPGSGR